MKSSNTVAWVQKILATAFLTAAPSLLAGELDKLSWLSGHWVSADGAAEEHWLEPRGGTMTGSFRWVFPNGHQVLEYLVIEEKDGEIIFRFKHYGTDFVPWEKDQANTYRLLELNENSVRFELEYSSGKPPQRYEYRREGDTLTFRGESDGDGKPLIIEFTRQ